jgi:hypothetical protein
MSKENRKHARLMLKANRLGQADLLEIACMKGMTVFTDPNAPSSVAAPVVPPVDYSAGASSSRTSSGSECNVPPNPSVEQEDCNKASSSPVAVLSEMDQEDLMLAPETTDQKRLID